MMPFKKPHTGPCKCTACEAYTLEKALEAVKEAYFETPGASCEELEKRAIELLNETRTKAVP